MNDASVGDRVGRETGPAPAGVLTIDLGALARNWRALHDRAGGAECAAVVKADAYGIGLEPAVRALRQAGCRTFFVAQLGEAVRARDACGDAAIYVLNGLLPGTAPAYPGLSLSPVLGSRDEVEEWAAFGRAAGRRLPAAHAAEIASAGLLDDIEAALVMSHFVSSEEPGNPLNARQIGAFEAVRQAFANVPASLCNSSGIFLPQNPHYDLVRPGYALYGGNPTPSRESPMSEVVRLEGRIVQLRSAAEGDTVGYNAQWTVRGPRRLATISVGYADGYPRAASATDTKTANGAPAGEAIVAGRRCPFAGRVSMDLIVVDVTEVPEGAVKRGDLVTLIGDELTLDEVARRAGTIGYEILTGLGRRYARAYVEAET